MVRACIQLFQLTLSPSKAEKSNTNAQGLLGIAKKLMNIFFNDSMQQAFRARIRLFRFARAQLRLSPSLGDNLN